MLQDKGTPDLERIQRRLELIERLGDNERGAEALLEAYRADDADRFRELVMEICPEWPYELICIDMVSTVCWLEAVEKCIETCVEVEVEPGRERTWVNELESVLEAEDDDRLCRFVGDIVSKKTKWTRWLRVLVCYIVWEPKCATKTQTLCFRSFIGPPYGPP